MAYHFAEFGDVNAEVEAFTKVAGSRSRALDIETSTNVAWATEFIQAIQKQFSLNRDQTMLYGSASTIPQGNPREFLLWVAAYHTTPNNSTVPNTSLWQYSDSGKIDGITNNVDLSKWIGTTQNFNSFFGLK
jgi:GH25 family lysozyme M1 (1,4-beta-N-acetylmuramidase)